MHEAAADAIAGTCAAISGVTVGHPFDLVKTRMQAGAAAAPPLTASATVLVAVRGEGPLSLFRGLSSALSGYVPCDVIMFTTYGYALRQLSPHGGGGGGGGGGQQPEASISAYAAAGLVAGVSYVPLAVPFEVVKIRMQVSTDAQGGGMAATARRIVQHEGPAALFRGFWATALREGPEHLIWFASFEWFKRQLRRSSVAPDQMDHVASLLGGGLAGVAAYLSMYPVDVVKTQIQLSTASVTPSMGSVARELYARQGLRAFYRGSAPVVLQVFPENAATLYVFDLVMAHLVDS